MEIYLIRHTTPVIEKGLIYGRTDVPLATDFVAESQGILKQLPDGLDGVYSSPSSRCTRLAAAIKPVYKEDPGLYELNFGNWEGKTWDTIDRTECDRWMEDFVNLSPPEGETTLEMQQRVFLFWNRLLQEPYQKVAVVTHGGVIRIILAHYKGISLKDSFTLKIGMAEVFNLSVSTR
ncbi:alpha-ribazole phosphatase [Pedobacter cryoconitis]|uniref:Alpha-ribazole phosphatase n=1 Tax=Pedobacter cryoconitis TaxID=188932 RepID=A0A7X0J5P5_9SPHI|nr:alpha-ribazole phosphatase [Pedobacter cryoconitis]MBB6501598.1 alpha-ribazole phosphatase [Pedobacter cryoconitis]